MRFADRLEITIALKGDLAVSLDRVSASILKAVPNLDNLQKTLNALTLTMAAATREARALAGVLGALGGLPAVRPGPLGGLTPGVPRGPSRPSEILAQSEAVATHFARSWNQAQLLEARGGPPPRKPGHPSGPGFMGFVGTVAAAQGVVAVGRMGANFEQAMAGVAAAVGKTRPQIQELTDVALEMGRTTVFSAGEAAGAMELLAKAGLSTSEILSGTKAVLNLAAAGGLELADASQIAVNITREFGLQAEDMGHVSDVIAKAASISTTNVESLGRAMTYVGPVARTLGVSIEDTAGFLALLADRGMQGTLAGTALRRIFAQLQKDRVQDTLAQIGLSMADVDIKTRGVVPVMKLLAGQSLATGDAFKIFGDRGAVAALNILASTDAMDSYIARTRDAEGTSQQMADTMTNTFGKALKELGNMLGTQIIKGFEALSPVLTKVVQGLTAFFRVLGNIPFLKEVVTVLTSMALTFGTVVTVIAVGTLAFTALNSALAATGVVAGVASLALAPITLTIVAIAGAVALGTLAWKRWGDTTAEASERARAALERVKELISGGMPAPQAARLAAAERKGEAQEQLRALETSYESNTKRISDVSYWTRATREKALLELAKAYESKKLALQAELAAAEKDLSAGIVADNQARAEKIQNLEHQTQEARRASAAANQRLSAETWSFASHTLDAQAQRIQAEADEEILQERNKTDALIAEKRRLMVEALRLQDEAAKRGDEEGFEAARRAHREAQQIEDIQTQYAAWWAAKTDETHTKIAKQVRDYNQQVEKQNEDAKQAWIKSAYSGALGVQDAFRAAAMVTMEHFRTLGQYIQSVMEGTRGAASAAIDSILQGGKKMRDAWKNLLRDITASFRKAFADMVADRAFRTIMSAIPGGGGAAAPVAALAAPQGAAPGPGGQFSVIPGLAAGGAGAGAPGTGAAAGAPFGAYLGGAAIIAGGAMVAAQGYRTGNPLQGAAGGAVSGAMIGSMILPGIGTIAGGAIGAVVGGLGGVFGGSSQRDKKRKQKQAQAIQSRTLWETTAQAMEVAQGFALSDKELAEQSVEGREAVAGLRTAMGARRKGRATAYNTILAGAQARVAAAKAFRYAEMGMQKRFGGGLMAGAGAVDIANVLSGGLSQEEFANLTEGAGGAAALAGGGAVTNNSTVNVSPTFIVRTQMDIDAAARRIGQIIANGQAAGGTSPI